MSDWYRNTSWDEESAAEFEEKLKRARPQKAQYLKIQGISLMEKHPKVAIELLERCAAMRDEIDTIPALTNIAMAWLQLGEIDHALESLLRTMREEEDFPHVASGARMNFCFLVALHQKEEHYGLAMDTLDQLPETKFGSAGYALNGARAGILAHRGEREDAKIHAGYALEASLDRQGLLTRHPRVGIVDQIDNPFTERLLAIFRNGRA